MATTTNYSWETPDDTDLVKDGAAAIRTLGSSVDTTTKALNPSTTLGDIEYRSATANTNTRLGIGSTGNVLTVSGGVPTWAAPAGGGGLTLLSTTTLSGATTTISVDPTGYVELLLECQDISTSASGAMPTMLVNGDTTSSNYRNVWTGLTGTSAADGVGQGTYAGVNLGLPAVNGYASSNSENMWRIIIPMPTVANRKIITATFVYQTDSSTPGVVNNICGALNTSAITSVSFKTNTATPVFNGGTIKIYGAK